MPYSGSFSLSGRLTGSITGAFSQEWTASGAPLTGLLDWTFATSLNQNIIASMSLIGVPSGTEIANFPINGGFGYFHTPIYVKVSASNDYGSNPESVKEMQNYWVSQSDSATASFCVNASQELVYRNSIGEPTGYVVLYPSATFQPPDSGYYTFYVDIFRPTNDEWQGGAPLTRSVKLWGDVPGVGAGIAFNLKTNSKTLPCGHLFWYTNWVDSSDDDPNTPWNTVLTNPVQTYNKVGFMLDDFAPETTQYSFISGTTESSYGYTEFAGGNLDSWANPTTAYYYWPTGSWRRMGVDVFEHTRYALWIENTAGTGSRYYLSRGDWGGYPYGYYAADENDWVGTSAASESLNSSSYLDRYRYNVGIVVCNPYSEYNSYRSSSTEFWKFKNMTLIENFRGIESGFMMGNFSGSICGVFEGTGSLSGSMKGLVSGNLSNIVGTDIISSGAYSGSQRELRWLYNANISPSSSVMGGVGISVWNSRDTCDVNDKTYASGIPMYTSSWVPYINYIQSIPTQFGTAQEIVVTFLSSSIQRLSIGYGGTNAPHSISLYDGAGNLLSTNQFDTKASPNSSYQDVSSSVPIVTIRMSPPTDSSVTKYNPIWYAYSTGSGYSGSISASVICGVVQGTSSCYIALISPVGGSGLITAIPVATFEYYYVNTPSMREGYVGWARTGSPQLSLEPVTRDPDFYLPGDFWTRYRTGSFHSTGSGYRVVNEGGEGISNFVVADQTTAGEIYSAKVLTIREHETSSVQVGNRFWTAEAPTMSYLGINALISDEGLITVNMPGISGALWRNITWDGGIYMPSQSIVAVYGNKDFYVSGSITASAYSGTISHAVLADTASYSPTASYTIDTDTANRLSDYVIFSSSFQMLSSYTIVSSGSQHLSTGFYDFIVKCNDDEHLDEYYSGHLYWFDGQTSSSIADEIILHKSGISGSDGQIFIRTRRRYLDSLVLEMASNFDFNTVGSYYFTFMRKL